MIATCRWSRRTTEAGRQAGTLACLLLFLLSSPPFPAQADRQPFVSSTVSWNDRTTRLEVVHRLHSHDARLALDRLPSGRRLSLESLEGRARLALQAETGFSLRRAEQRLPLTLLGAELLGDTLFIYQESEPMQVPGELTASSTLMQGLLPGVEQRVFMRLPENPP